MNVATLDTHRIVKRLIQAGFSDMQAETVTDVVRETHEHAMSDLATKSDLAALRADLAALDARLDVKIAELKGQMFDMKADILKWMIGLILVQGGIVVTLGKLLPGGH